MRELQAVASNDEEEILSKRAKILAEYLGKDREEERGDTP